MNLRKRRHIFERLAEAMPEPKTELVYHSPFELLLAVLLSAQMTDAGVNRATEKLFKVANTPASILALGPEKLGDYLKSINLYPTKTKNILALSKILLDEYQGKIPQTRQGLEALPGVGRKTASVVLNVAFGEHHIPVDTHVFRVSRRIGLAQGDNVKTVENELLRNIPPEYLEHAHHWLVLHGRYTCTARRPKCAGCVIRDWCEFPDKTLS